MKGIVLAGGSGTRLYPVTRAVSKQLLPVYDKPMIYYPAVDADAGRHPRHPPHLHARMTCRVSSGSWATARAWASPSRYAVQPKPEGLAQAFLIGADFIAGDPSASSWATTSSTAHGLRAECSARRRSRERGATSSPTRSSDPERYGVVEFDATAGASRSRRSRQARARTARSPASTSTTTGGRHRRASKPSPRGELEITDVNRAYLAPGRSAASSRLGRGDRLAGHRHARIAAAGGELHPDPRRAPGSQDRLPGGDRFHPRVSLIEAKFILTSCRLRPQPLRFPDYLRASFLALEIREKEGHPITRLRLQFLCEPSSSPAVAASSAATLCVTCWRTIQTSAFR